MALPDLTVGLIVRYEYLWSRRAARHPTADKDHPACVVLTYRVADRAEDFVIYLPLSHSPPGEDDEGIEIPDAVKARAGLDAGRQWILVSECNLDVWPQDLRMIPPGRGRFHYGHLPPGFFRLVRDRFVARFRARRVASVRRDDLS